MSLLFATLLPGLLLIALGGTFLISTPGIAAAFKAMPRSHAATFAFFYGGTAWFLCHVLTLSQADFGQYRLWLFLGFTAVAVLAYYYVPDFLAVRGLAVLILLSAWPLLMAGYMNFDHPQIYFLKVFLYLCVGLAIWLGAQPWRLRDFFQWLFATRQRARVTGAALLGYGLLLCAVAFTY